MGAFLFLLCANVLSFIPLGFGGMRAPHLWLKDIEEFDGTIVSSFPILTTNGTALSCQDRCLRDTNCMSYFHNRLTGSCQTHEVVFFNPEDGMSSSRSRYYRNVHDFCPSQLGYIYNRALDLCYKFIFNNKVNQSFASQVCSSEDGRLVIADNLEKLYHLGRIITASTFPGGSYPSFLVGATDKQTEGQWRWSDDQTLPMPASSYWCPGEPNDSKNAGEDYAAIRITSDLPGCLNDVPERIQIYFICEIPM